MKQKLLKTMLLLCALVAGSLSVWADPTEKTESWTFSGSDTWTTGVGKYCGCYGAKSAETTVKNASISNFSSVDFSTAISPSVTIYVTGLTNSGTNSYTVSLVDKDGKDIGTSQTKSDGLGTGTNAASASESYVTLTPVAGATGYRITVPAKGALKGTRYVLTYTPADPTSCVTPTFEPSEGAVASGQAITISCGTAGATIYYTTDGSVPSTASSVYNPESKPIVTSATTFKAYAVKDGLTDSGVATASYTIAVPCETPEFSEPEGELEIGTSVEISCDTDGATIYYTTNGSTPTTSSTVYSSAIKINTAQTIKAIAVKDGMANSAVASISYTVHDYTSLPFNYEGGILSDLTDMIGTTYVLNDKGSYATSHAPYRIKFTNTGDYIQIKTDAQPSRVYIGVKMIGGATESKITVKASADGSTFDTGEELTISGSSNSIVNLVSTRSFASTDRYIRLVFTKGSNVGVGPISVIAGSTVPATLNASGYATFASGFPLDFSDDSEFSAWQITAANSISGVITFSKITGVVPSCTGVLLKKEGASSNNINIPVAGSGSFDVSSNLLKGITYPTTVTADTYYGLSGNTFKKVNAGTVPAGKALLPASVVSAGVKAFTFVFEDDNETSINSLTPALSEDKGYVYDLSGRRVQKPTKGLYIVNGKKVLF